MPDFFFPAAGLPEEAVVDAYLDYLAHPGREDASGVGFHVSNLVFLGPRDDAWRILVAAIEQTTSATVLCRIGAGDLENLVVNHGLEWIDAIEERAADSPNFRTALGCVWGGDPPVRERIDALLASPAS